VPLSTEFLASVECQAEDRDTDLDRLVEVSIPLAHVR
jgi:hypothetical protein